MPPAVTFYFDLGSPYAYLVSERLHLLLPEPVEWRPVLLGGLFKLNGRSSWAGGESGRREAGIAEIERRAHGFGLPPVRWPDAWPTNYLFAMRVATYAFAVGRGRQFVAEAFRDAFQRGRELSVAANVLDTAQRTGLDPVDADAAVGEPELKEALRRATDAAHGLGVIGVPTVGVGEELFWGDDRLEDAAARLKAVSQA
jgi:2-hydroxychromene-2-carboxylate isomerase